MQEKWMYKALWLAYIYKGTTSPNPTVGAVLIDKNGYYVDSSVTQAAGKSHAERHLLQNLPLETTAGGTLYVTLEPCCFTGKTPPCTDIIIEKQIAKVIIATLDPNPKVQGLGVVKLQDAGIIVEVGILEQKAKSINQDFFYAIQHHSPFIFAKVALSLDGCMATHIKDSQWISKPKARRISHILRYRADAILIGANTVIQDNPTLNARLGNKNKALYRIVLDFNARVPLDSHVLADDQPTLWVINQNKQQEPFVKNILSRQQKEIFFIHKEESLDAVLEFLYHSKHIISIMVEGGSMVLTQLLKDSLIKAAFLFYGCVFLGNGLKPFNLNIDKVNQAPTLKNMQIKKIEDQFLIFGNI